jgi:hypothetical protein
MAEGASSVPHVPQAWIGQEVHVIYVGTATTHDSLDCVLQEVNNMGIAVVAGEMSSFLPWSSVIRLDLGHAAAMRVR